MPFKINVSDKGKTIKFETDSEALIRQKIGEKINGSVVSSDLDGYELEIAGHSDFCGFPGIKGHAGGQLRKVLFIKGEKGYRGKRNGLRLKKSIRGEEGVGVGAAGVEAGVAVVVGVGVAALKEPVEQQATPELQVKQEQPAQPG